LRDRTWVHRQLTAMASFTFLLLLALPLLLPLSLLGARLPSSRLASLMMASLLNPSSFSFFPQALGLLPHALGSASEDFFYTRISFDTMCRKRIRHSTLGAHPLPVSPLPSPQFPLSSPHQHPVLASLPFPSPLLLSLPALLASLHSLPLHLRQAEVFP